MVILLNWWTIFKWCLAGLGVKNGHQEDTCYDEISLCAQNMILGLAVNPGPM